MIFDTLLLGLLYCRFPHLLHCRNTIQCPQRTQQNTFRSFAFTPLYRPHLPQSGSLNGFFSRSSFPAETEHPNGIFPPHCRIAIFLRFVLCSHVIHTVSSPGIILSVQEPSPVLYPPHLSHKNMNGTSPTPHPSHVPHLFPYISFCRLPHRITAASHQEKEKKRE